MRFAAYRQNGTEGLAAASDRSGPFHGYRVTDDKFPGKLADLVAIFGRFASSLIGHGAPIVRPRVSDGTGAFGPWLVTSDELPPGSRGLRLQTRLNGEVVQDASTDDLVFDVATLVSVLSEAFTLQPGDVIVTGTPSGVGLARKPPLWMKPGDVCEVELEGLGILRNPVADQAAPGVKTGAHAAT